MNQTKLKRIYKKKELDFFSLESDTPMKLPLFDSKISAGFPSPAEDYVELKLDLNEHLIQHPAATFFVKVSGHSMKEAGIHDGDMLIVDRALEPKNNDIAVCVINGEFTVKRIRKIKNEIYLIPANADYQAIKVSEQHEFQIWGIVSFIIHKPK
jgi:DNA polymerase V